MKSNSKPIKQVLSLALAVVLALGLIPVGSLTAFAAGSVDYLMSSFTYQIDKLKLFSLSIQFTGEQEDLTWGELSDFVLIKDGTETPFATSGFQSDIEREFRPVTDGGETLEQTHFFLSFKSPITEPGTYQMSFKHSGKDRESLEVTVGEAGAPDDGDKPKMDAPANVEWVEVGGIPGILQFDRVGSGKDYEISVYKEGAATPVYASSYGVEGKESTVQADLWWDGTSLPSSGEYYALVRTRGDAEHSNSDSVRTGSNWSYVKPAAALPTPANLRLDGNTLTWDPIATDADYGYVVWLRYYENGEFSGGVGSGNDRNVSFDFGDVVLGFDDALGGKTLGEYNGTNRFEIAVLAASKNISDINHSEEAVIVKGTGAADGGGTVQPPVGPDRDDDFGFSSSSFSGADTWTAPATSTNVDASGSVSQTAITREAAAALGSAEGNAVILRVRNAASITAESIKSLSDAGAAAGKNIVLHADTMSGMAVQGRLYLEPAKLASATKPIKLGIYTEPAKTASATNRFERFFDNTIRAVVLEQQGSFGARLEIAAKVDLTGLNLDTLRLYSYNQSTNTYTQILNPAYRIDANGYLHFHTERAGTIIITDKALTSKS